MEPLARFKTAVAAFEASPSEYTFEAAMAAKEAAYAEYCSLRDEYNRVAVEFVGERGDVVIGESRFYVGTTKSYKPRYTNRKTADLLLSVCGGDADAVYDCLSASCWKAGAVRSLISDDDQFNEVFETVIAEDIKTGKPKKEVKKAVQS